MTRGRSSELVTTDVIFTLGEGQVNAGRQDAKDEDSKVPSATMGHEYRFPDEGKSTYDLIKEDIMLR